MPNKIDSKSLTIPQGLARCILRMQALAARYGTPAVENAPMSAFEIDRLEEATLRLEDALGGLELLGDAFAFRGGLSAKDALGHAGPSEEEDDEEDDEEDPVTVEIYCKRCVGSIVVPGADKNDPAVAAEAMAKGWTQTVGVWRCKACIEQIANRG